MKINEGFHTLNQLKKRYDGASWSGADGDARWSYEYDANGNLTRTVEQVNMGGGVWDQVERWVYDWNPRDQMTRAMKVAGSSALTIAVASIATL